MKSIYIQLRYNIPLFFVLLLLNWLPDNRFSIRIRGLFASLFIKKCGRNFTIGRDVTLLNSYNLFIGNDVYIAKGTWINAMGKVVIEDEVAIAPYVVISSLQHTFENFSVKQGGSIAGVVKIGSGTWLASHVSVKCNVAVGKGNLVAANSFVSKDTPDFKVVGGVPAKIIKEVENGGAEFYNRKEMFDKE